MYTQEEKAEILLDSLIADHTQKMRLFDAAPSVSELLEERVQNAARIREAAGEKSAKILSGCGGVRQVEPLLREYEKKGVRCVCITSDLYPEDLRAIPDPPLVLYCKGDLSLLQKRKFAIVGSRRTSPQIVKLTERYARELAKYFVVVSGLAEGGDTAALTGAAESGNAISVLAYGFDHVYPESNRNLMHALEKNGLLVSEYTPQTKPRNYYFPLRNRVISGLCDGVLVVSGGERSGTRITADLAWEYGRDVFAFPYSVGVPSGVGCNAIIKEYAKLTDNLVDITSAFGINLTETEEVSLTQAERAVYEALCEGETHLLQISERTGLGVHELPALLTLLEMKNMVVSCGGNRYAAVR